MITINNNMEECEHNWKRIYYRKMNGKRQEWLIIPDKFICDKCMKIFVLKEEE